MNVTLLATIQIGHFITSIKMTFVMFLNFPSSAVVNYLQMCLICAKLTLIFPQFPPFIPLIPYSFLQFPHVSIFKFSNSLIFILYSFVPCPFSALSPTVFPPCLPPIASLPCIPLRLVALVPMCLVYVT